MEKTNVSTDMGSKIYEHALSARRTGMTKMRDSKNQLIGRRNTASSSFSRKQRVANMSSAYNINENVQKDTRKHSV